MQVSVRKPWEALVEQDNPEALYFDGFDDAVIGIAYRHTKQPLVAYSRVKMLEILVSRIDPEQALGSWAERSLTEMALEWFEFNIACAWCGEGTPIIVDDDPDHREE